MSTKTDNYELIKPALSETYDVGVANSNADTLDMALKDLSDKIDDMTGVQITSGNIADKAITTAKINDYAVTAAKIGTAAITNAKLANNSVSEDKIIDNSITESKLSSSSVTSEKIADKAITTEKLDREYAISVNSGNSDSITDLNAILKNGIYSVIARSQGDARDRHFPQRDDTYISSGSLIVCEELDGVVQLFMEHSVNIPDLGIEAKPFIAIRTLWGHDNASVDADWQFITVEETIKGNDIKSWEDLRNLKKGFYASDTTAGYTLPFEPYGFFLKSYQGVDANLCLFISANNVRNGKFLLLNTGAETYIDIWEIPNNSITSEKIVDDAITAEKCAFLDINEYPNKVDLEAASWLDGYLLNTVGWYEKRDNYTTLNYPIAIEPGKTYSFNHGVQRVVIKQTNSISDYSGLIRYADINNSKQYTVPTADTKAKYMFLSFYSQNNVFDAFRDIKVEEGNFIHENDKEISLKQEVNVPNTIISNLANKNVLTLGDQTSSENVWQYEILKTLKLGKIMNFAVSGNKVANFANNVTAENIADIDIVIVMGLFNSTLSSPGTVNDAASNSSSASICAGYKYIVDKLLTLKPTVKIVLMSPHRPRANDVAEKAAAVGEVAKYYGLPFIDLYNTAGFNSYTYDTYLRDSVNSTSAGYLREAETIGGGLIYYFG